MSEQDQTPPITKKRSKIVTAIAWAIALVLVPACGAWVIGRWVYWFDIAASHQMLISWIALGLGMLTLSTRRIAPSVLCLLLVCVSFYPVIASRQITLDAVTIDLRETDSIRVVSSNINPLNETWEDDLDILFSLDADVVVIIEVPILMNRLIRKKQYLDDSAYPNWAHRYWVEDETSPGYIVSRWPIEILSHSTTRPDSTQHNLFVLVHAPGGDVVVGLIHPKSPRTSARWMHGNRVIGLQASAARSIGQSTGLPVLLAADLNAGPAQLRAQTLRRAGFKMSKPITKRDGSYPIDRPVPSIMRIQLDDIWSRGNIRPIAWDMIELPGSDHQAVIVDFEFIGGSD